MRIYNFKELFNGRHGWGKQSDVIYMYVKDQF